MFAPKRLLIKGGKIVNDDAQFDADVFIEGEKIKLMGLGLVIPRDTKIIDAKGKWIIPGGINAHTHLISNTPDVRHSIFTGTQAALAGGTTTIIDFMDDTRKSLLESYEKWRVIADQEVCCDYGFTAPITSSSEQTRNDMEALALDKGVNSFMMCPAFKNMKSRQDIDDFFSLLRTCQKIGGLALFHCKEFDLSTLEIKTTPGTGGCQHRNPCLEAEAKITEATVAKHILDMTQDVYDTFRVIASASKNRCPLYVLQVHTIKAAEVLRKLQEKGSAMYGEAKFSSASEYSKNGSQYNYCTEKPSGYMSSPSLSEEQNTTLYLMTSLKKGILQSAAIDRCGLVPNDETMQTPPFSGSSAEMIKSIEYRMSFIWEKAVTAGSVTPSNFVAMTSTNIAKLYNLYPNKGRIQAGSDADIVVWDAEGHRNVPRQEPVPFSNDYKIFEGIKVKGKPIHVIYRGKVVVENERPLEVKHGSGRFLPTLPFAPAVYLPLRMKAMSLSSEANASLYEDEYSRPYSVYSDENDIESVPEVVLEEIEREGRKGRRSPTRMMISNPTLSQQIPFEADWCFDNKSTAAAEGKQAREETIDEFRKPQSSSRKPTQMDKIFNTGFADQKENLAEVHRSGDQAEDDLLLAATTERAASSLEFRRRPPTRSGGRNMLDSTFSLSGAQIDDDKKSRPTIRVKNPPGGRSSGIWYS